MTTAFILEYIPQRMAELGFGKNYTIQSRTLRIAPNDKLRIPAYNVRVFFPSEAFPSKMVVESGFGYLEREGKHNQNSFEHTGRIVATNKSGAASWLTIIEAIPFSADQFTLTLQT